MARHLAFRELTGEELIELQRILRSRSTPSGLQRRAQLIWELAAGASLVEAATQLFRIGYDGAVGHLDGDGNAVVDVLRGLWRVGPRLRRLVTAAADTGSTGQASVGGPQDDPAAVTDHATQEVDWRGTAIQR